MITREQFDAIKKNNSDAMLLFIVGDFCELYYDDAERASRLLGLTLTTMNRSGFGGLVPMTGFPVHCKDAYIGKLLAEGLIVAIVEQERGELRHQVRGEPVVKAVGGEGLVS